MVVIKQDYQQEIDALDPKTPRIQALLDRYYNSEVRICPRRSRLATESWKETEGQPLHIRRAKLFAKICDEIPTAIFDQELIVGAQNSSPSRCGVAIRSQSRSGLLDLSSIELMPYHQLGRGKYVALGKPYKMGDAPSAKQEDVEKVCHFFKERGIKC